ncbi:unnamed protein product, partial [Discosporangium mesarthrocarpum]
WCSGWCSNTSKCSEESCLMPRLGRGPVRCNVVRDPSLLQPVSSSISTSLPDFVRRKAWTAPSLRFSNGIIPVTSLCIAEETPGGGLPVLIAGDENGGVAVQHLGAGNGSDIDGM